MSHDPCRELNTTYCGYLAQQWWTDYLVWEKLLNTRRRQLSWIVEIGSGSGGGFSLYLAHQAQIRMMGFRTYDLFEPLAAKEGLLPDFMQCDVFSDTGRSIVTSYISAGQTVLHCDGGDKPREVREFGAYLQPGCLAVVHDYGYEFLDSDIPSFMEPAHEEITGAHAGLSIILQRL